MNTVRFAPIANSTSWRGLCRRCAVLVVTIAAAAAFADAADSYPEGRIYTSIFFRDGNSFARHLVAVDPRNGACETIAKDGIEPRVSPDGQLVAYWTMVPRSDANSTQTDGEVWVKKLSPDAEPQKVWAGDGAPHSCWTRDGKHLIVIAGIYDNERKKWKHAMSLVDPETSEAQALDIASSESVVDSAHHSDLRLMMTTLGSYGLYCVLPDRTNRTMITRMKQTDYQGRFSPDDKKVVVLRSEGRTKKVCTVDTDGKNVQVAYTEKELTNPEHVGWSPDGKRLAVVLFDWQLEGGKKIMRAGENASYRIAIMDLDGGNYHEVTLDRAVSEIGGIDWR